jgi:hypothetical protein
MEDTSPHKTLSDIIEGRIKEVNQKAIKWIVEYHDLFGGKRLFEYALALDELYNLAKKNAPEVLPEIEELVKNADLSEYYTHLFYAIGEYIRSNITDNDKTHKNKIENLKEGLKLLLNKAVSYHLRKLDWKTYMGKTLPELNFYIDKINEYLEDTTGKRLDIEIKWDIEEKAARNYLSKYIDCLLSNPKGYIQHMKAGDLEDFIRESCKPIPS